MLLALAISAFIFALVAFGLGLFAIIEVMAQKRSTHAIQYVPADQFNPINKNKSIESEQEEIDKAIRAQSEKFNDYIPLNDAEDFLDV